MASLKYILIACAVVLMAVQEGSDRFRNNVAIVSATV